ncbi:MAG: AAA family ATPase [Oscillospiraceae bacterium]|nr:AAA family ATPase [Oscillospiraceae bacterium]
MWIKKLYATFGKLDNKTLELAPGLNIVTGSNESGKSTWSAFIRAMFFGISTREKAKVGYLPDKEKYRPWSGSPMYGRMELVRDGDELEIERTSQRSGVFSKESARNITSGAPVETGEALVGVARGVYERTAFIGQSRIGIDGDADTEKRILAIASSGNENISAAEVISRLEKKQRELRSVRGLGALPEVEAKIYALEKALSDGKETQQRIHEAEGEFLSLSEKLKTSERALKIAYAEELRTKLKGAERAKKEYEEALKELQEYADYPVKDTYSEFLSKLNEWQEFTVATERSSSEFNVALREKELSEREKSGFTAFEGMDEATARQKAEDDKTRLLTASEKKTPVLGLVLIFAAVLLLAAGVLLNIWFLLPGVFFAAAGIALAIMSGKKTRTEAEREITALYGGTDSSVIEKRLEEYILTLRREGELSEKIRELSVSSEISKNSAELRNRDILEMLSRWEIPETDFFAAEKTLRERVMLRENAHARYESAKARLEVIKETLGEAGESVEYTEDEIPDKTSDQLEDICAGMRDLIKKCELELATLRERMAGTDIEKSEEELQGLYESKDMLELEYEAYALALKGIAEADSEIRNRFSPEVEKRASEIFSRLCGGSFEVVRIKNSDFEMEVAEGVASTPREQLTLSQGTLDELYFSLRIALCEMILSDEDAPPMVLDDVFVNFDGERMARALELLRDLSETRQIILFTCHTREAEYFEKDDRVNKVNI